MSRSFDRLALHPMHYPDGTDIARAAELLRAGKLVALPTETVYGLGADALNPDAVARVFEAKGRPHFDPLIVHVPDVSWLPRIVARMSDTAAKLAERFWPGPLTLVLPKTEAVPDLVTSGLPTVAVRIPSHPMALDVIRRAGTPIAAPSANPFGRISPTTAAHVIEQLGDRVEFVLDGGPCTVGIESTVVQLTDVVERDGRLVAVDCPPALLRPGGLTLEEIEAVIGPVTIPARSVSDDTAAPAPGMLTKHYAPRTPLDIWNGGPLPAGRLGLLTLTTPTDRARFAAVEVLSSTGDLREAAVEFFAALRRLDAAGLDRLVATPFPDHGLGRALNDRLRRAAAK